MDQLIESLRAALGRDAVLGEPDELLVYECDGLPQHKHLPRAVVFPASTEETAEIMRLLARAGVPFTPRGAGTGLSGGALALNRGVVIELARMRKILRIDETNRVAVVQTGVVNLNVSRAVGKLELHYVPDPSSQPTCTIGGNIAENAGGIHCLKYGTTTDHVLGARVVLAGGEVIDLSGAETESRGYDLLGIFVGSEGTFGVATEATLRLVPNAPSVRTFLAEFAEVNDASHAVSAIIAAGVMPAALEMMDREIIRAVEASVFAAGLPLDAGAALLIELDGLEAGLDEEGARVESICLAHGARKCRRARDENERKKLWAARKGAFGAIGRIAPDSMIQDAVVPRSRLPEVLNASYQIASKYQLRLANVFHAGDGNLHPLICFDSRSADEVRRVKEAGRELMETCVRAGGSITGEHGVGLDKRDYLPLIFSETDMDVMLDVRAAFDPLGLCNPGKIIPLLRGCGEAARAQTASPQLQDAVRPDRVEVEAVNLGRRETDLSHRLKPLSSVAVATNGYEFDPERASKRIEEIVGPANAGYFSAQPNGDGPLPSAVLASPGSIEELGEVLRLAFAERWTIRPAGAATWLETGSDVGRADIIVSTRRLNRLIEHEPADLIARAEAGIALNIFNEALSRNGQWLPLDPPDDGRATIGGVVATGISGAQKCGYGPPRRYVIGMKIMLADGRLVKAGGRVVKNVAGYDLCKLFTGSYGTLGIITELTFKLRPIPAATRTILVGGSLESLLAAAGVAHNARLFPVAIELVSNSSDFEVPVTEDARGKLLMVRFAGSRQAVTYQSMRLSELLRDTNVKLEVVEDDGPIWQQLAALPLRSVTAPTWRATIPLTNLPALLAKLDDQSIWQAGMAEGRVRVIEHQKKDNEVWAKSLARLRGEVESLGGSLIMESAPSEVRREIKYWGEFGTAGQIARRIKQQLDPKGTFAALQGVGFSY